MGDFIQAVKWMKEGKKVRARFWKKNSYIYSGTGIKNDKDELAVFGLNDIEATNWELFEEKKTLSDKYIEIPDSPTHYRYKEEDVKQALKEFIENTDKHDFEGRSFREGCKAVAKEIFGERLI